MRRTVCLVGTIGALSVFSTAAFALSRVLHGPAGPSSSASVDVQFNIKKGHPTKVTRFEFNNIPVTCPGSAPDAVSDTFSHHISVSSTGKFHAKEKTHAGQTTYTVSGHFTNLHKASGKLRVKGPIPGCAAADTGLVHWSAKG